MNDIRTSDEITPDDVDTVKQGRAPMTSEKLTYFFGAGQAEGGSEVKHLVGGKGASLADMTRACLNVPPGFTISAACCDLYFRAERQWPADLEEAVRDGVARLEQLVGRPFGRGGDPLLVAVRSGAAQSMPGMMDTVLNVGLNPDCVRAMAERTGQPRAAWEAYRHFLVMFGHTVGGVAEAVFADVSADLHRASGKKTEDELDAVGMEALCDRFRQAYRTQAGRELPTEPWEMLRQAIDAVFGSWHNERADTYRRHHGINGLLGTAVNVQAMCPAEVSGVMFTANPVHPELDQLLIESSYGLGEAIVLGKVTPDRFVLDKSTLHIVERTLSAKDVVISTVTRDGRVQPATAGASLTDSQLVELGRLGQRVESYFKVPCDIEWALSAGEFYLLQARPIKGLDRPEVAEAAERAKVRGEELDALRARAEPTGTVWSRFNLSEILPEPTPMTWAIVRHFMSGNGGFGLMYRDLGFDPDPALDEEGVFDLVCGRPYCNLSREPRLHYRQLPFEHSFAALKADASKALYPQPTINPSRAGWKFWLMLPFTLVSVMRKMVRAGLRQQTLNQTFPERFRREIVPHFEKDAEAESRQDLAALDSPALLERLAHWMRRTLEEFGRESLKPTALAALAMASLESKLGRSLGATRARQAVGELVMGVHPDEEADLPRAVRDVTAGTLSRADFLQCFGHRGSGEMELAQPRWSEDHVALDRLLSAPHSICKGVEPEGIDKAWERIAAEAKVPPAQQGALRAEVDVLRTHMGLRETAKHHLMRGYALIRRILVELDRRYHLDGGIFYLLPEELPRLVQGEDLTALIATRKRRRALALSLECPPVLFSDDLDAVGRPIFPANAEVLQGVAVSPGTATAPALVLTKPNAETLPAEPYILVCPSTDPAWVPLFVQACGLVMETGGVLSHGAIVARDFGLPAVAGLPGVTRQLKSGQRLSVDGAQGTVSVIR